MEVEEEGELMSEVSSEEEERGDWQLLGSKWDKPSLPSRDDNHICPTK